MKYFIASWWLGTQIWRNACLKINRLDGSEVIDYFNASHFTHNKTSDWVANLTQINRTKYGNTTKRVVGLSASTRFLRCNSSSCSVDSAKVKTEFHETLILIFGCSLDIRAIGYLCHAANGVAMESIVNSAPFSYLAHCSVGGVTLAYIFHPGASAPPYSAQYNPLVLGTTRDILQRSHHDIMVKFGKEPNAIIVDASLWDVSNWWGKIGSPPYPYPVQSLFPYLERWCNNDVPQLLTDVATIYPTSAIAFRTAPTVFGGHDNTGQHPLAVDSMVDCLDHHSDAYGKIFGRFTVIDYHQFVDGTLQAAGASGASYYQDSLHPGAVLSLVYLNNVLNWVQQLR